MAATTVTIAATIIVMTWPRGYFLCLVVEGGVADMPCRKALTAGLALPPPGGGMMGGAKEPALLAPCGGAGAQPGPAGGMLPAAGMAGDQGVAGAA